MTKLPKNLIADPILARNKSRSKQLYLLIHYISKLNEKKVHAKIKSKQVKKPQRAPAEKLTRKADKAQSRARA